MVSLKKEFRKLNLTDMYTAYPPAIQRNIINKAKYKLPVRQLNELTGGRI